MKLRVHLRLPPNGTELVLLVQPEDGWKDDPRVREACSQDVDQLAARLDADYLAWKTEVVEEQP